MEGGIPVERTLAGGILGWPTSLWHSWMGWLPDFLRVVVFVVVLYILLRLLFGYGLPAAARVARPLAIGTARAAAWIAVRPPEYVASLMARRLNRPVPASFAYGEAVAGLLEASERGIGRVTGVLRRVRMPAGKLAFWSVITILVAANAIAYHAHTELPAVLWWHSVTYWAHAHAAGRPAPAWPRTAGHPNGWHEAHMSSWSSRRGAVGRPMAASSGVLPTASR